jgi:restriction endonuclease S subunit
LAVYLNSDIGQKSIQNIATGSTVRSLSVKDLLEKIEIPVLSEEEQNAVVSLYKNIKEQRRFLERKVKVQEQIINGIINELI